MLEQINISELVHILASLIGFQIFVMFNLEFKACQNHRRATSNSDPSFIVPSVNIEAHRSAIFLCSWDDSLVGQLSTNIVVGFPGKGTSGFWGTRLKHCSTAI